MRSGVEDIVGSRGKMKIISLLARLGEANITKIVKETGLRYDLAKKHLEELVETGIIEEKRLGRLRVYSLRYDNPRVLVLLDLIRVLEDTP